MSVGRGKLWLGLILASLAAAAHAQLLDEELQEQLELWAEQPLDLSEATAEELARLPWLDWAEAKSLVTLRENGSLRTWDDLALVPGLDPADREAIRPFVELDEAERRWPTRVRWRLEREEREGSPVRRRERGELRASGWSLVAQRGETELWWGARFDASEVRVAAGRLRLDAGTRLLGADPLTRSRLGAVSLRTPVRARVRTDTQALPGFQGLAIGAAEGRWLVAAGRDAARSARALLVWDLGPEGKGRGGAVDLGAGRSEAGVWWAHEGRVSRRWEIAGSPGAWRSSGSLAWRGEGWSLQAALTSSLGASRRGVDPITGQALDRPHRAGQLVLRHRSGRASFTWTGRVVERGPGAERVASRRLRLDARWSGEVRWEGTAEVLEGGLHGPGEARWRLHATLDSGRWRRRAGLAWRGDAEAGAGLAWLQLDRRQVRVAAAVAGGEGSSPWAVATPEGALRTVWLRPGDLVASVGWGLRAGDQRLGVWAGARWRQTGAPESWIGARWEAAFGPSPGAKVAAHP